ncbi:hypothetical protein ACQ4LE_001621 [Meloidogyne hapla]
MKKVFIYLIITTNAFFIFGLTPYDKKEIKQPKLGKEAEALLNEESKRYEEDNTVKDRQIVTTLNEPNDFILQKDIKLDDPKFYYPDEKVSHYTFNLNVKVSRILEADKKLEKLAQNSLNFYQLLYSLEKVLLEEKVINKIGEFFKKNFQTNSILYHFKNLEEIKNFKNKLVKKIKDCQEKHNYECKNYKNLYNDKLKLINEAIDEGIMNVLYAKEFCSSIDDLYNNEDDKITIKKFCQVYVEIHLNEIFEKTGI